MLTTGLPSGCHRAVEPSGYIEADRIVIEAQNLVDIGAGCTDEYRTAEMRLAFGGELVACATYNVFVNGERHVVLAIAPTLRCGAAGSVERSSSDNETTITEEEAPIHALAIQIVKSNTPQYVAVVLSGQGGGCTGPGGYLVERDHQTIRVTVTNLDYYTKGVACTLEYAMGETIIPLGHAFDPHTTYTVVTNGETSASFTTDGAALGEESDRREVKLVPSDTVDGGLEDPSDGAAVPVLAFVGVHTAGTGAIYGLNSVISVAFSPDGKHFYAVSFYSDSVAVFSRDPTTGAFTTVETRNDGYGRVDGLDGAVSVIVSPDGKHVYVAADADDAVSVFSRDTTTGVLDYVEVNKDDGGGVDGLDGVWSVTVSPDGKHVYAASRHDDAVAVFSRNSSSGALTFVEVQKDGVGGVDGLRDARSVTVSPDGKHLYAASSDDDAVAVFSRNSSSGTLTFVEVHKNGTGVVEGLAGAFSVAVSPDGRHLYAAGSDDDAVVVFSRNATTGALTFDEVHRDGVEGTDGLDSASSVMVSPDGNHLYVSGHSGDAVAVFGRNATTGALKFAEVHKDGVGGIEGLREVRSVAVSPDGQLVLAAGSADDAVAAFSRDSTTGALVLKEVLYNGAAEVHGLWWATSITISPDGNHVYVTGYSEGTVAVFSRNSTTGALTYVEVQKDGVDGVEGLAGPNSAVVSPDGLHLYVTGALDDTLVVFSRNATTGALTYVETLWDGWMFVDGLEWAWSVAISPDGDQVYVAGLLDDAVAAFHRSTPSGFLAPVEAPIRLDGAASVTVSPDGKHVYAVGSSDDAVAVYNRNTVTGVLTFVEVHEASEGGFGGASSVVVSPDGKHVYVAGQGNSVAAVYSRNSTTGTLTFLDFYRGYQGGFSYATMVTFSPDGNYLYAPGRYPNVVGVYRRNPATGAITYLEARIDGVEAVKDLAFSDMLTVSPDGKHIYAVGVDSVAVFSVSFPADTESD